MPKCRKGHGCRNEGKNRPKVSLSVRLMAPFSMHCTSCNHFIYRGTKFNARKQATSMSYLGVAILSFSIRCPRCAEQIIFRTDPKNGGYAITSGACRNADSSIEETPHIETDAELIARIQKQESKNHNKFQNDTFERLVTVANEARQEAASDRALVRLKSRANQIQQLSDPSSKTILDLDAVTSSRSTKSVNDHKPLARATLPSLRKRNVSKPT